MKHINLLFTLITIKRYPDTTDILELSCPLISIFEFNQNWNTSSGSFLVRPQIIVVPLPGGSNMPRAESREQSALGIDGKRAPGL